MDWNKILIEVVVILIQGIAHKCAKYKMSHPETVRIPAAVVIIMPVMACVMSILLTSTVYGPVGMLVLSIVLLYWKALRESC